MLKIIGILMSISIQLGLEAKAQVSDTGVYNLDNGITFIKNISWKGLLKKASEKDKMIFIDVYTTWCVPCKKMQKEIFPLKKVSIFYNKNFISYQANAEKGAGLKIANKFNIKAYPTYLFVNKNGTLVFKGGGYNSDPKVFIEMGKKALRMQTDSLNLIYYKKEYPSNKKNKAFLKNYLSLLSQQGLPDNKLLDQFVSLLSDKELSDSTNATLIINMLKTSDSKAFEAIIRNQNSLATVISWSKTRFKKFEKKYPPKRILSIALEHIIMRDFMKAISSKNKTLFKKAIGLASKIENAGHKFSTITIPLTKVKFYALAGDTLHLKDVSFPFADSLMQLSSQEIDSVDKRMYEEKEREYLIHQMDSSQSAHFISHKERYKHLHSEYIGNILNEIAKDYCILMIDPNKLEKALQWSRKAIKLNHSPKLNYTYARLLYKLGQKNEAVKVLMETIKELQLEDEEEQAKNYKKDLLKMKKGTL